MPDTALLPAHDPPHQKWFRLRKAVIWIFWTLVCLSIGTVIWALFYVNDKGFTRKWRRLVTTELAKRGVHANISRLTLNPVQGLVARDVELIDPRDQGRVLATINELVLNIDYSGLVHGRQFLRAMDLYNAQISLPLDPDDPKSNILDIVGLNATVRLPPNKVEFDAEATVHGLRVKASGRLANPTALRSAIAQEESANRTIRGHQFLRLLDRLEITGGDPLLELQVDGDLARLTELHAKATLQSGPFTIGSSYPVKAARLHASYNGDGLLRINQCVFSDRLGELDASGMIEVESGRAIFRLSSSIDLQGLLHAVNVTQKVDEFVFYTPPLLDLSGEVMLRPAESTPEKQLLPVDGKVQGSFSVGRFTARSVMFEGAGTEFSWEGDRWFLRDARLSHRSGNLSASILSTPDRVRFQIESNLPPKTAFPLLPASVAESMKEWEFLDAPHLRLRGEAPSGGWDALEAEGDFTLGATRFRGLPMKGLRGRLAYKQKRLDVEDFRLDRAEGRAVGSAQVTFTPPYLVTLRNVRSTLNPQQLAVWIDARGDLPRNLAPYRFRKPPVLKLDGSVELGGDDHTLLKIDVDGRELDYHFISRDLFFPKIKGILWLVEDRLKIDGLEGDLFGGKVYGGADISINPKKGDYHGTGRVEGIDFPSLTGHYLDYQQSKGKLNGTYDFEGRGEEVRNLSGKGSVSVTDGNVFDIPLFGPFSGILNTIIPGTGYNVARKATASFTMAKGVAETRDLKIEGKGFSMYGSGKLFYLEDKIDFGIRINAHGPVGFVLTPVSHLFEYVSDESLLNPVWRPKRLPKGFFNSQRPKAEKPGAAEGVEKAEKPRSRPSSSSSSRPRSTRVRP